jgi:hypothetical protein
MIMNDNNTYKTSDTPLATYLYAEGFQIIDIDYTNPRAEFVFKNNDPLLINAVHLYTIGKGDIDAATYARLLKKLTRFVVGRIPWTEGINNA